MKLVVEAVLPLFALILAGYVCGWRRLFGPDATNALNLFVVWLALPALLFQALAEARFAELNHPAFVLAVALGMLSTFVVWLVPARGSRRAKALPDASIEALAASYPNSGFMGIPLCLAVFGPAGLQPAIIATILTACLLFGLSLALIEIGLSLTMGTPGGVPKPPALAARGGATLRSVFARTAATLARNPLLVAPALGALFAIAHIPRPSPLTRFTALLGSAASPCALVTIGLFLAQTRGAGGAAARGGASQAGVIAAIVALKMLVQPLVTGLLGFVVFDLPRPWSTAALLLSALPIGTGPFMLAKLYDREAAVTSRAILLSTVVSLVTTSLLVAWIARDSGG